MRKDVFIHIGFGKTGTSSVQEFFFSNRVPLAEQGLQYPLTGLTPHAHHGLAIHQTVEMSLGVQGLYKKLVEEISSSTAGKVLLSSEQFCFLKKAYIAKIKEFLSGYEVKIIFYIRKQPKLIESTFLEWQKAGMDYKNNIEKFYEVTKTGFDFSLRLQPWIDEFGSDSIIVRVYDRRAIGDDTCLDVMKVAGLEMSDNIKVTNIRANPSLLPEFSAVLSMIDSGEIKREQRKLIVSELLALSKTFKGASTCALINKELYGQINEYYKSSNSSIAHQFLLKEEMEIFLTG